MADTHIGVFFVRLATVLLRRRIREAVNSGSPKYTGGIFLLRLNKNTHSVPAHGTWIPNWEITFRDSPGKANTELDGNILA